MVGRRGREDKDILLGFDITEQLKKLPLIIGHLVLVLFLTAVLASVFYEINRFVIGPQIDAIANRVHFSSALLFTVLLYSQKLARIRVKEYFESGDCVKIPGKRFLEGFLAGASIITMVVFVSVITGLYSFDPADINPEFYSGFSLWLSYLFVIVAFSEELLYRGLIFRIAIRYFCLLRSILLSALLFSLTHVLNSGFSLLPFVNIILIGFLLGSVAGRRSLWWPIGFHFGWNFFEGLVFSLPVSGLDAEGFWKVELQKGFQNSPYWGHAFGPEGSIITTFVLIIVIVFYCRLRRLKNGNY